MNINTLLDTRYAGKAFELRQKAKHTLFINAFLAFGFLSFSMIRIFSGDLIIGLGELGASALLMANIIILIRGGLGFSANLTLVTFIVAAIMLFSIQEHSEADDIYRFTSYYLSIICVAPLVSSRIRQLIAVFLIGLIGQSLLYYFLLLPALSGTVVRSELISVFAIALGFLVIPGFFAIIILKTQLENMGEIQKRQKESEKNFQQTRRVVESMKSAFNVGNRLMEAADNTKASTTSIDSGLREMEGLLDMLKGRNDTVDRANEKIHHARESVSEKLQLQTAAVEQSSSASEELTSQINSIAQSTDQKLVLLKKLLASTGKGSESLERTLESLKRLNTSSSEILDVIKVIEDIAGRTNLLAMNAAIEAAHAGESGKGFAVVADEIRKLSEETNSNSKAIRASLEENGEFLRRSEDDSSELQDGFSVIDRDIQEVDLAMKEIQGGMQELSDGTASIIDAVSHLKNTNSDVGRSLEEMEEAISENDASMQEIRKGVQQTGEGIAELAALGRQIVSEADQLAAIGEENISKYSELEEEMKLIRQ